MLSSPRLLLFAGPNGSRKSTVTTPARLKEFGVATERYINADDIARMLREEMSDTSQEKENAKRFAAPAICDPYIASRGSRSLSKPSFHTPARSSIYGNAAPSTSR